MKSIFLTMAISCMLYAQEGLLILIESAHQNELVDIYKQNQKTAELNLDSLRSSYLPRIDIGARGVFVDETGSIDVGQTYTAFAEANVVLFDGFKRENANDELKQRAYASETDLNAYKKKLSLQIAQYYYRLLNIQSDIEAQEQNKKLLQQELVRQKRFLDVRIVTEEDVERINAALANADYQIAQLNYDTDELKAFLQTLTGIEIDSLIRSELQAPDYSHVEEFDSIKVLRHQSSAMYYAAEQSTSSYLPSVTLNDTYSFYDYDDEPSSFPIDRADQQNRLTLNLKMNLVDFSAGSKQKEALMAQKMAIDSKIAYENKLSKNNIELSKKAIERSKLLIHAAELALSASEKTFNSIEKKYHANVVDYVKYLDALYQKSNAQAQFNTARNALQLAYAQYFYYAGFDIKEFIK